MRQSADWIAQKKAELVAAKAEVDRIGRESGYSPALQAAKSTNAAARAAASAIVDYVPVDLPEAARMAAWSVNELEGPSQRGHIEKHDAMKVLRSIAAAGV
jgi:hypothetical protein